MGKSTLLNRLVGGKIAITSPRPQTTRNRIVGVYNKPELQVVFVDTPGVVASPKSQLNKSMVEVSARAGGDCDLLLFITDASKPNISADSQVLGRLKSRAPKKIAVINKIDLARKSTLPAMIKELMTIRNFDEVALISARTGENVDKLTRMIAGVMPEGPMYYPDEMITDQPERFVIGELVREKAIYALREELPYSIGVVVESMEERKPGLTVVMADIYVERESQKGIVIGKKGEMLKKIGSSARKEMEQRLATKVFLDLRVKVKAKWTSDARAISRLGYATRE